MYHGTLKPLYLSSVFLFTKIFKDLPLLDRVGQNILVIIPLLLVITYLRQLICLHLISQFQLIASSYLATSAVFKFFWLKIIRTTGFLLEHIYIYNYAMAMAVNALVMGLIVFRILRVFLEVKGTSCSVERTSDSIGGTALRHIIFVIIESGMALFASQLVHAILVVQLSELGGHSVSWRSGTNLWYQWNVLCSYNICSFLLLLFYW